MRMVKKIASTFALLALAAGPALAQFYQYTDRNGNVVITDSPPAGAEAREKKVDEERIYRSTKSGKDHPSYEKKDGPVRAAVGEEPPKKNYSGVNVVMYMTDW